MTHPRDPFDRGRAPADRTPEDESPSREDARFVERLAAHYAPPPLTGARRTAFDARLRERLEAEHARRAGWRPVAALAAVAAAGALAWLVVAGPAAGPDPTLTARAPEPAPEAEPAPVAPQEPPPVRVAEAPDGPTDPVGPAAVPEVGPVGPEPWAERLLYADAADAAERLEHAEAESLPREYAAIEAAFFATP